MSDEWRVTKQVKGEEGRRRRGEGVRGRQGEREKG